MAAGLRCRVHTCRASFAVTNGDSMEALRAAIADRNAHEVAEHAYHHVAMVEPERAGFAAPDAAAMAARRARKTPA